MPDGDEIRKQSGFLSDEEYEMIANLMAGKGYPKFHLIAFNTEDVVPAFKMASGFESYHDVFVMQAIIEIFLTQLNTMCYALEHGENIKKDENVILQNVKGNA